MKMVNVLMIMVFAAFLGCNSDLFAQSTTIASVSASVVTPIGIAKNVNMNFGNAAVSSVSGGALILAPAGTRSTGGGGVTLPATSGTVAAAGFTVSGAPGYTFAISLPGTVTISGPGAAVMTVNGFTSTPSATGTLSSGGTQTLAVGATLNIAAAQSAGAYTNASAVPVTVNYN